jgi:hypothetical protein
MKAPMIPIIVKRSWYTGAIGSSVTLNLNKYMPMPFYCVAVHKNV